VGLVRVWHLPLLAACYSSAALAQQSQPSTPPTQTSQSAQASSMFPGKAPGAGQYAETDMCKTCHADVHTELL